MFINLVSEPEHIFKSIHNRIFGLTLFFSGISYLIQFLSNGG